MSASVLNTYGSAHDPLCPYSHVEGGPCEVCDLIARVREDYERAHGSFERSYNEGYYNGRKDEREAHSDYCSRYAAALRDAVEAVKALPDQKPWHPIMVIKNDAVAAIENLRINND